MENLLPTSIGGLSLHPLVVHATVVIVPLAAVTVLLAAVLPRFRRWAGWLPLLLAAGALVLTPLATSSGENFEHQLEAQGTDSSLIAHHASLSELLIWWVVPLFVVALATYLLDRRDRRRGGGAPDGRPAGSGRLGVALGVLGVVVGVGTVVEVVLIGHSGAQAVWGYLAS
jgi:hypothetical protein